MDSKRALLLAALVAALGLLVYARLPSQGSRMAPAAVAVRSAPPPQSAQGGEASPVPDWFVTATLPPGFVPPPSPWLERERAAYTKLLGNGRFDVLVIPAQVQSFGYDRATRALASALLARRIASAAAAPVPDPELVAKALGDGQRSYAARDIAALASALGVKRIVELHLGHDAHGALLATVTAQMPGTPDIRRTFTSAALAASDFAIAAFETQLPEILEFLGLHDTAPGADDKGALAVDALPDSPLAFVTADGGAARRTYVELVLRRLAPSHAGRVAESCAAKAYLALSGLAPEAPEYRALRARAVAALGYRAAARAGLGAPQTEEERAIAAYLDGNLPALRKLAAAERNPLKRLLEEGDANELGHAYGVIEAKASRTGVERLALPGRIWPTLAWRAFSEWDPWTHFDNLWVKAILDLEFPIAGYAVADLTGGAGVVVDEERVLRTLEESVRNHGAKYFESAAATACCAWHPGRPTAQDYMDLLQAVGDDNLLRRIDFQTFNQGRPEAALDYAATLDALYRGNAYYALSRANAAAKQAANESGAAAEGLQSSSHDEATAALYWEQGQSPIAADAEDLLESSRITANRFRDNPYVHDLPSHPEYSSTARVEDPKEQLVLHAAALDNSISNFFPVEWILFDYAQDPATREERSRSLLESIASRFIGNPARGELLAKRAFSAGDREAAMKHHRENTETAPGYWPSYLQLGDLLLRDARPEEAARVFASFPDFRADSDAHPVAIANDAFEAGSGLFLSGHLDLARPLYEIAARADTQAAAELTSRMRLHLLDGDLAHALAVQFDLAQHYRRPHQYREYLALLFAGGHAKEGWAGFNALVLRDPHPQIWEAALVGQCRAGIAPTELATWLRQPQYADSGDHRSWPAAYLLRYWVMDRVPPADLAATLDELDMPTWQLENEWHHVARPRKHEDLQTVVGPPGEIATPDGSVLPIGMFDGTPKQRVESDLAYFSTAFRAYETGDYPGALKAFEEAATVYDLSLPDFRYMLPYFALASSRVGNTSTIEKIAAKVPSRDHDFDALLVEAIIAAAHHDAAKARRAFTLARYNLPPTDERPLLTHFTYGDIGERLAGLAGDPEIKSATLDWARANMTIEPWHAWSAAVIAKLTDDDAERGRVLAMLQYLDPGSAHLAAFPKAVVDRAVAKYASRNPLLALKEHVPELEL